MLKTSIDAICLLLSSSKIRDRNEALVRLEDINFTLSSSQNGFDRETLLKLIESLASYIDMDRTIFEKSNENTVVEIRLNKASFILRSVIINILASKKFISLFKPRQSERIIEILLQNLTYAPVDTNTEIFEPVALNCLKTLNHLLKIQCFKDNLFPTTYETLFNRSIKCLKLLVIVNKSSKNENLMVELFMLLYDLLNPSYTSNHTFLFSIENNSRESNYAKIFQIILEYSKNIFADNKRERESLIYAFKIINKLLLDLSTIDVKLCHSLYKLGVTFILEVKAITSKRFVSELAIFINLISPFIAVSTLYKIKGDSWNISRHGALKTHSTVLDSTRTDRSEISEVTSVIINPSSEAEESNIVSEIEDEEFDVTTVAIKNNKRKRQITDDSSSQLLDDLSKVIEIVFNLFHDSSLEKELELPNNSINLHIFPFTNKSKLNWFHMKHISLTKGYHSTPWLLRLGLVKLIVSFYDLKSELSDKKSLAETGNAFKRQRAAGLRQGDSFQISDYIQYFDNFLDLILSLLSEEPFSNDLYNCTIAQLLTLGFGDISSNFELLSSQSLLNQIISKKTGILTELINIFEKQDNQLKYWVFFSINLFYSICTDTNYKITKNNNSDKVDSRKLKSTDSGELLDRNLSNKLLKYSLEFLKDLNLSKLSCILLSHLSIFYFTFNSKSTNLDKSIIQQYENIIDLSEINGPAVLSKESVLFWVASVNICKNFKFKNIKFHNSFNSKDSQLYSHKICNWLLSKTDQLATLTDLNDIISVCMLYSWTSGIDRIELSPDSINDMENFYMGESLNLVQNIVNKMNLCDYILMRQLPKSFSSEEQNPSPVKEEILTVEDSTIQRLKLTLNNFIASILDNPTCKQLTRWCIATCIFLRGQGFGYDAMLDKMIDVTREKFTNMNIDTYSLQFFENFLDAIYYIPLSREKWIRKISEIISLSNIIEISLRNLNFRNKNIDNYDEDNIIDIFNPFMPTKTTERFDETLPDYSFYNYMNLYNSHNFEQNVTNACLKFSTIPNDFNRGIENTLKFTSRIKSKFKYMATQFEILKFIEDNNIYKLPENILDLFFNELTSLLEDHTTKTYECSLVLTCKIFGIFSRVWLEADYTGINSDGKAVYDFLLNLYQKKMIHTEETLLEFFKFLLKILKNLHPFVLQFDKSKILDSITVCFSSFSNFNKYQSSFYIKELIKDTKYEKFEVYSRVVKSFADPQQSIESSATFCYFLTSISSSSESLVVATVCNLLEISTHEQIRVYLPHAINNITTMNEISNSHDLFWNFKEIFFKCWESFELPIQQFPYELFGFFSLDNFFMRTYKEITALSLAYNHKSMIPNLAQNTNMKQSSIVNDSISLSITLSWTKGGIKNKIFKSFEKYFTSSKSLKSNIKEQFLLIIFQLFRFCDCSSESDLEVIFTESINGGTKEVPFLKDSKKLSFLDEYELSIKPKGCIEMINYFADTCGINEIWTVPVVYHISSKLLLLVESSVLTIEKKMHLRRLKLLYMLSPNGFTNPKVCDLLVKNLSPYLLDSILASDSAVIMKCILRCNEATISNLSVTFWIILLTYLLRRDCARCPEIRSLRTTMLELQCKVRLEKYSFMFNYGLGVMDTGEKIISFFQVVEFVNQFCKDTVNTSIFVQYLSLLFECSQYVLKLDARTTDSFLLTPIFIQNIYNIKLQYSKEISRPLLLWIGKCLGMYYQVKGKCPYTETFEFDSHLLQQNNRLDFNKEVKSLDSIFQIMINELPSASLKSRYCFETIVGVILFKKKVVSEDIALYVSYNKLFEPFEDFIYPMGNYMCSLSIAQVETDTLSYYRHGLEVVLNGFSTKIVSDHHEKWVTQVLFSVINELSSQTSIIMLLANYISHIPSFAIKCFCPLLIYFIENQPIKRGKLIGIMIHDFFVEDPEKLSTEAISLFVELALLIRVGTKSGNEKFISVSRHLDIPHIYEAALHIGKNKAALMLLEDYYTSVDLIDIDSVLADVNGSTFLRTIYEGIEDSDLVFGLPIVPELSYGLEILRNNGIKWDEMMFNNAKFEASLQGFGNSENKPVQDITTTMMDMGWSGISNIVNEYSNELSNNEKDGYSDIFYEQLWKLNQWDIPTSEDSMSENRCIYNTLKQIKESPLRALQICENSMERLVVSDISNFGRPGVKSNEPLESWMRSLCFCNVIGGILKIRESDFDIALENFEKSTTWFKYSKANDFENILLGRRAIFEIMGEYNIVREIHNFYISSETCWFGVVNELHTYNHLMTSKGLTQKAINAAVYLNQISCHFFKGKNNFVDRISKYNLAKAFWTQQSETRFPVETLREIIKKDKVIDSMEDDVPNHPQISSEFLMATLAQWCDQCKQVTSSTVMKEYIDPIVQNLSKDNGNEYKDLGLTYHIMAKFCDNQVTKYEEDTSISKLSQSIHNLEKDIQSLTKFLREDNVKEKKRYALQDLNRLKIRHKTQSKELLATKTEKDEYIEKAIDFYLKSIALNNDDMMENDIDRFCSLWLEHNSVKLDENELISLPSFNFVSWNNQLTSRLLDDDTKFQKLLKNLIINIAMAHPFHTLYLLKSLRMTKNESDDAAAISRGSSTEKIWEILSGSTVKFNVEGMTDILEAIDSFADKAVEISNVKLKNTKKVSITKLPDSKWWIDILPSLLLPSPVKSLEVLRYWPYRKDELSIISKIDEMVLIAASGVSHPKIMKILLSTGETQKMLLKAPDDLRQDSIMKQVFEKVNKLLWKDIETRKRKLRIRTYNVLPLGPSSGVLEFVPNSMPLVDILKPLHKEDPIDINEARLKMKEVQNQSKNVRYQTYNNICKNVTPNLRVFFFNNFTSPDSWFASRSLYCHGIATTSITGYVLGIGDRHCNNILLDKASGEPIHIDFGVAFDQGKALPVPETVPFRLTRDLVDGLGITGVNGMFNKSCEHVLRVLRDNTQYICGILDVLKYDPLYSWTLSPLRKKKLQQIYFNADESDKGIDEFIKTDMDSEANAAIETVKKKLEAKGLSDEAVVRELIREATDSKNLSLIFMGWSPFL